MSTSPVPADSEPMILDNLVAAGLVNHELIGDPARLPGEVAVLRTLCRHVAGPVYRVAPFHYAFAAGPQDLAGQLGDRPQADWAGALAEALQEEFGPEAAWISPTDLLAEAVDGGLPEVPVLMLRAWAETTTEGIRALEPGAQVVIGARFAAEAAGIAALGAAEHGASAVAAFEPRLAAMEEGLAQLTRALAARPESDSLAAALTEALTATLTATLNDRMAGVLSDLERRLEQHATTATAAQLAHEEHLGLTLAEFLARIEAGQGVRRLQATGPQAS